MYIKTLRHAILVDDSLDPQITGRRFTVHNSGSVTAVRLPCDPTEWPKRVHLAWFIIGKPQSGYVRWHCNGDKLDFRKSNLEWRPFGQVAEWGRAQARLNRHFQALQVPQAEHK